MLYDRCDKAGIPYRKTGKLILATSPSQTSYLDKLLAAGDEIKKLKLGEVPLKKLSGDEVRELEPDVGDNVVAALLSPETGIVSSHDLMADLEKGKVGTIARDNQS